MFPEMQLWLKIVLALALAFAAAFATTPPVKAFAVKVGAIDVPKDARRVHKHPIPRMGGLAIFIGFILAVLLFAEIDMQLRGILIGCVIIVATGAIDDVIAMKWWVKLLAELVAAALSQAAFIEHRTYPAIAKYHLNNIGVKMTTISRTCDVSQMGEYDILCVEKMNRLIAHFEKLTGVR